MSAWTPIIVAIIAGPLMWGLLRLDKRNTNQHETAMEVHKANQELLTGLRSDVSIVKTDVLDVKADVRDVKSDVRQLRSRVDDIEEDLIILEEELPHTQV